MNSGERPQAEAGIHLDYAVFETDELHEIIYQPVGIARKSYEMGRSYLEVPAEGRKQPGITTRS